MVACVLSNSWRQEPTDSFPSFGTAQPKRDRTVWREGLEVAFKVKGFQEKPHVELIRQEHPFTAISPQSEVHANHNEAQNSSLRRRASAYRRGQNHYTKVVEGLQRDLDVQRLIHNWVRPHWGLEKNRAPAIAMGYHLERPVAMLSLLSSRALGTSRFK